MHTIHKTLTIRRPPDVVFDAWSNAEAMAAWFAPMAVGGPKVQMEFAQGGTYRIEMDLGAGYVHVTQGVFQTIERPHLIVMTWHCDAFEDPQSLVTIQFLPVREGTQIQLRHDRVATDIGFSGQTQGWVACLDALTAWLEGPKHI